MTNGNDLIVPAFDAENDFDNLGAARLTRLIPNPNGGITKREYFAAMAMQGLLAADHTMLVSYNILAEYATDAADALIAELNKPTKKTK